MWFFETAQRQTDGVMRNKNNANCTLLLISICIFQFVFIVHLYVHRKGKMESSYSDVVTLSHNAQDIATQTPRLDRKKSLLKYPGAAVFLNLHQPTWFQRRYSMMIQNVDSNIPADWVIQVFWTAEGQSKAGIDINRGGLQRLIDSGRLVLTTISPSIFAKKRKKYELMVEPWIWENMLSDTVFLFGGTSVICSNSPYKITNFTRWDYIGSPWSFKKGIGGDGAISIRNRTLMLSALNYELNKIKDPVKRAVAYKNWGQEDQFFISRILEMQKEGLVSPKLAPKEETLKFSAIDNKLNNDVFVVSGTLAGVPYDDRQKFHNYCPEIKMFYPTMHDPSCFGAEPDGDKCALTICALRPKNLRRGGC